MKPMETYLEKNGHKKPKLPRKTKKRAIRAQGRKWYHDTIMLYRIIQKNEDVFEPVCRFWVNSSITHAPIQSSGGKVIMLPTPKRFW